VSKSLIRISGDADERAGDNDPNLLKLAHDLDH
jgi:hypothetical protein